MSATQTPKARILSPGRLFSSCLIGATFCALFIPASYATIGATVDNLRIREFQDLAHPIATLAIMVVGISAMIGRVSWATALTVIIGIAIFVGAGTLAMSICSGAGPSGPISCTGGGGTIIAPPPSSTPVSTPPATHQ